MTRIHARVRHWKGGLLAWSLGAALGTVQLAAQETVSTVYEQLAEPRIVERADERVLEVRAVGDPNEVGSAAFGLLFQLYFSSGAATGFAPPVARARWQEGLDEILAATGLAATRSPSPKPWSRCRSIRRRTA